MNDQRDEQTCRCGMWPVDEYGPICPSCEDEAEPLPPPVELIGYSIKVKP